MRKAAKELPEKAKETIDFRKNKAKESAEANGKSMKREAIHIATIATDAAKTIRRKGLGIELDQFCWADLMYGEKRNETQTEIREEYGFLMADGKITAPAVFHAPFNELHPAAIDSEIREIAFKRYEDAIDLASAYGIKRLVVHSGYVPFVYLRQWHRERSGEFWNRLMAGREDVSLYIENVLESNPAYMKDIAEAVNLPNVQLCLDVGHSLCMSKVPPEEWIEFLGEHIGHIHIHDNDGKDDLHLPIGQGAGNMDKIMNAIEIFCPRATMTIESRTAAPAVKWMEERGYIEESL